MTSTIKPFANKDKVLIKKHGLIGTVEVVGDQGGCRVLVDKYQSVTWFPWDEIEKLEPVAVDKLPKK